MGGNWVKIKNETPYPISYVCSYQASWTVQGHGTLCAGQMVQVDQLAFPSNIFLKQGHRTSDECLYHYDLYWWYHGINFRTFTIREKGSDKSELELICDSGPETLTCPNYGKQEKDRLEMEKRRREEEERRQAEQRERERKIQEQIETENKRLEENLSQTLETLTRERKEIQRLSCIQQFVVNNRHPQVEYNEVEFVEKRFNQILKDNFLQDEEGSKKTIVERIQNMRLQIMLKYIEEKKLSDNCLKNWDDLVGFKNLTLRDELSVLEAMIGVSLNPEDLQISVKSEYMDERVYFILLVLDKLFKINKELASYGLKNFISRFSEPNWERIVQKILKWKSVVRKNSTYKLSASSWEFLSVILFNELWGPAQTFRFYIQVNDTFHSEDTTAQDRIEKILHLVLTYQIEVDTAISALQAPDSEAYLNQSISTEKDKDLETVLCEMRSTGHPERILTILKEVLPLVMVRLPSYKTKDMKEGIHIIKAIDLDNPDSNELANALMTVSLAVKYMNNKKQRCDRGYHPRLTQMAALLTLLLSNTPGCKGCLLEIATGEGKSCIVAMFALFQAIRGKKVDVITSSPVLARRDQEEWKSFYEMFGVKCSVIPPPDLDKTSENTDKRIQEAYKASIVYGTIQDFAADILRQEFEKKDTRGKREFNIALVDEVDYMTLDSGVQLTYLSHEATGLRHLDQLITAVWAKVCMCQRIEEEGTGEFLWTEGVQYFHNLATSLCAERREEDEALNLYYILERGVDMKFISNEDLQKIKELQNDISVSKNQDLGQYLSNFLRKFGPSQQKDLLNNFAEHLDNTVIFKYYILNGGKAQLLDSSSESEASVTISVLLLEGGYVCLLVDEKTLIDLKAEDLKSKIFFSQDYTPSKDAKESAIILPKHLKEYTENRLPIFIENALLAIVMQKGREYTIAGRFKSDSHEDDSIIPIDYKSTGVLEKNKRWGDGLQQFLEMKHQLALSPLSNVTNFLSNYHFFQRYVPGDVPGDVNEYVRGSGIYGVSGTLGDEVDLQFLRRQYKTSCYVIPTHRHNKRVELPAMQVPGGRESWITKICDQVEFRVSEKVWCKGQVALVICEDIRTANEIQSKLIELKEVPKDKISMYTRSDEDNVEKKLFVTGEVIIATNLGGRGTDIKVTDEVNGSGGLIVILTHFPTNMRVEKQTFGRTARKGNPGMVQMILNQQDLPPSHQGQSIEFLRSLRAKHEQECITKMEQEELVEVNMQHELFSLFCQFLAKFETFYSEDEKMDIYSSKKTRELSSWSKGKKIDFHPALNALKETWSLWLTLHEKDIRENKDIKILKKELSSALERKSQSLQNGESENFYDFIKVAMGRTYLNMKYKKKEFGALSYWEKAENTDPVYQSISLYNRAFITINSRTHGYIEESIKLLSKAMETMNIYESEIFNSISIGNIVSGMRIFEPHRESPNFTLQMETRLKLLKCWVNSIEESINKLNELKKENKDAVTEERMVYSLCENYGTVMTEEMSLLHDYGLTFVFKVMQKPEFSFSALACFLIGALQVIGGALICVFSAGLASQIGIGLIAEGISDMISGVHGMITGAFSWVEYAISKAISLAISLVSGCVRLLRTAANAGKHVVKEVNNVAKISTTMAKITTTGKEVIKKAVKQSTLCALDYGFDQGLQAALKEILKKILKHKIKSYVEENQELSNVLLNFIIGKAVPEMAKHNKNFQIASSLRDNVKKIVEERSILAFEETMRISSILQTIKSSAQLVSNCIICEMEKQKAAQKYMKVCAIITDITLQLSTILITLPTESVFNKHILPKISTKMAQTVDYTDDPRAEFPDVLALRKELQDIVLETLFDQFSSLISSHTKGAVEIAWGNHFVTDYKNKMAEKHLVKVPGLDFFIKKTDFGQGVE